MDGNSRDFGELILPGSLAAKTAHLRSIRSRSRVGALHVGGPEGGAIEFRENELLIAAEHADVVDEVVGKFGGSVAPELPLPPRPRELGPVRGRKSSPEPPTPSVKVVFDQPPRVPGTAEILLEATDSAPGRRLTASSEMAASVAALAQSIGAPAGSIGVNTLGKPAALDMWTIVEGLKTPWGSNRPADYGVFSGPSRLVDAWQLVDSFRTFGSIDDLPTLVVLDFGGFWVDRAGNPVVPTGQTKTDFDNGLFTINADDGGRDITGDPVGGWHGNAMTGIAAATVNNAHGIAGSGGSVAFPIMMKASEDVYSVMRGIRICANMQVDVVSISIFFDAPNVFYRLRSIDSDWVKAFQYAVDSDVVVVASAGNKGELLPDYWTRPATRTPGVITVGGLDADNESAAPWSNYGSSVAIWAPGTAVPALPDPNFPNGALHTGTSPAAPLVAGTAAMMRAVNPGLSNADIRRLIPETGWSGKPLLPGMPAWFGANRVTKGLDAFAAVRAALDGVLPDPKDPGDTLEKARPLKRSDLGMLVPRSALTTVGRGGDDVDYWSFSLDDYARLEIQVLWYHRIARVYTQLLDSSGNPVEGFDFEYQDGLFKASCSVPQGKYFIRVTTYGLTAYSLVVHPIPMPLAPDRFESNNSFDTATPLRFRRTPLDTIIGHGPGTFDLTLHRYESAFLQFPFGSKWQIDSDFFKLSVPQHDGKRIPFVFLNSDKPVTVTLYDELRNILRQWAPDTYQDLRPPEQTTCYLKVSGDEQTRYTLTLAMTADPKIHLKDFPQYEVMPEWWVDPGAIQFVNPEIHYGVELTAVPAEAGTMVGDVIAIASSLVDTPVTVELLDLAGNVVAKGERMPGRIEIDTRGVEPGAYALRLARPEDVPVPDLRFVSPTR